VLLLTPANLTLIKMPHSAAAALPVLLLLLPRIIAEPLLVTATSCCRSG
jgi:hypothetical protein